MIIDEAGIDTNRIPGFTPDPALKDHFTSFDGSVKSLRAETFGGGTWLTELSALTGLSTRSFGPFAPIATRMVADRYKLSLPEWLGQCGYATRSIYPAGGRFMSARRMHDGLKVQSFEDWFDLKELDPASVRCAAALRDNTYFRYAIERIAKEPQKPSFTLPVADQQPIRLEEKLSPEVKVEGMPAYADPDVAEYVRRQRLADTDLRAFKAELAAKFPGQPSCSSVMAIICPLSAARCWSRRRRKRRSGRRSTHSIRAISPLSRRRCGDYQPVQPMPKPEVISASYLGLFFSSSLHSDESGPRKYQATISTAVTGCSSNAMAAKRCASFNGWLSKNKRFGNRA